MLVQRHPLQAWTLMQFRRGKRHIVTLRQMLMLQTDLHLEERHEALGRLAGIDAEASLERRLLPPSWPSRQDSGPCLWPPERATGYAVATGVDVA